MHDNLVYNAFGFAMLITGEPQLIGVSGGRDGKRVSHEMIAYGIYKDGILVADPNDQKSHSIPYKDNRLATYSGSEVNWDMFYYDAKSSLVSWDKVQARWAELKRGGKIGENVFPAYTLSLTDDKGKKYDLKNYDLKNPLTVETQKVKFSISSVEPLYLGIWDDSTKTWLEEKGLQEEWDIPQLKDGDNIFGLLVDGKIENPGKPPSAKWDDFKWVNISLKKTGGVTIDSASITITIQKNDYASYNYTASGTVTSVPTGSTLTMKAVIIDPKIGQVMLTGAQNATGGWSYTKDPNYKFVRFEKKAGEPDSFIWTITGSGMEGASYAFPGCAVEFTVMLGLNNTIVQQQTMRVNAK